MKEKQIKVGSGLPMIIVVLLLLGASSFLIINGITKSAGTSLLVGVLGVIAVFILSSGFFTLQPNQAAALIFFGDYKGSVKQSGWHWTNPFYSVKKVSLRSRNLNGEKLKVNDEMGNPIEIAAVVVWRVEDTFNALFGVDNYIEFVRTQSESALRHLAGLYPYDITDSEQHVSLRGSSKEVAEALQNELQERLSKAGVVIEEARLSHLAYAPEIAAVMLQRQQASAIIVARQRIVEGAVGMVQMALDKLNEDDIVHLDEERKAAMVSNLLVVLCGEKSVQPIINSGTLYS